MLVKDNLIYWCDSGDVQEDQLLNYWGTLVCAEKVRWRRVDEFLGEGDIFVYKRYPKDGCPKATREADKSTG